MFEYYDLSPVVSANTAVFPGDQSFLRKVSSTINASNTYELSSITTTLHLGSHADAPSHYHKNGEPIHVRPLHYYYGDCQVVAVSLPRGARISPSDIDLSKISAPRVLFKTSSYPDPNHWNGDFNSLSPELIRALHSKGVILVGLDTPSVDPSTSKPLDSHQEIYRCNLAVLEGLDLKKVPEGRYTLVALPLKLKDCEASPVRAILLPKDPS